MNAKTCKLGHLPVSGSVVLLRNTDAICVTTQAALSTRGKVMRVSLETAAGRDTSTLIESIQG